jgi:aerobic carbon-monoxide dehydrogenase medium subunit
MKPSPFAYHAPPRLDTALELLTQHGADAKVLAGGQRLVPLMNLRLARPAVIVDLNPIAELTYVHADDATLVIGAMTRQRTLERDATIAAVADALAPFGVRATDMPLTPSRIRDLLRQVHA